MTENQNWNLEIETLFPQTVGVMRGIFPSQDEIEYLQKLPFENNVGNYTSVDLYLLQNPELSSLEKTLSVCLEKYFDYVYKPHPYTKIKITQSWLNLGQTGQYHHFHCHPNSLVSGCLYIRANKQHHSIDFHRVDGSQIFIKPVENTPLNSLIWNYPVEAGQLILFPSRLYHSVPKNELPGERISLAFNTFATGILGDRDYPTELKLTV